MARREEFVAIHSEGGLLAAGLLTRVAALDSDLDAIGAEAYYLAPGEKINDAVTRSWNRILGLWESITQTLADGGDLSAADTRKQLLVPLFQELGYGHLEAAGGLTIAGRSYPISHVWQRVPIHLLGTGTDLDRRTPGVAGAAQASPHGLVQEFLNRSDQQLWAIVANGRTLRLLRDNASLTRQAYLEFDLETILDGQHYADFRLLWLLAHASRLDAEIPEKCVLEQWRLGAHQRGSRALDQLRDGVERAIEELGTGFVAHPGNSDMRAALQAGDLPTAEYYRELLRVVYRVIFLLVAESRDLLHPPSVDPTAAQRYREHYSLQRHRTLAGRRGGGPHSDLWAGLQVVFGALGHPEGLPALGLPALGSALWSAETTEHLNRAQLANRHFLGAIRALTTVADGKVVHAVDYRNLGAEELGSIYESLLEQHPEIDLPARQFTLATAAGNERKTTGSYYTPTGLIDQLLDTALDPVVDQAAREADPEHAILSLTVLDPACGSGHFLIAAAHRIAQRLASVRSGEDEPAPNEVRAALRDVIGRCIHGIDVNPMAVELCKFNLWLEAVTPGKPLSFLDHRIVCGDALLGVTPRLLDEGLPDAAFAPITGDDQAVANSRMKSNRSAITERRGQLTFDVSSAELAKPLADAISAVDAIADDDMAAVQAKERLWAERSRSPDAERARLAADAWCAAFVVEKVKGAPLITDRTVRGMASNPDSIDPGVLMGIRRLRDEFRFLHPHLAFPDVFVVPSEAHEAGDEATGWTGGFSVVLGNPPWEQLETDPREFFASTHPAIANAASQRVRNQLIDELAASDPHVYEAYRSYQRRMDAVRSFVKNSGRNPLGSYGRINTAPLFLETSTHLVATRGTCGLVLPTGIATDRFNSDLFSAIVEADRLVSLYDFRNSGFFEDIASSQGNRFCLVTLRGSSKSDGKPRSIAFLFGGATLADLHEEGRMFELNRDDIRRLNPETGTAPVFASRRDADICSEIFRRHTVLGEHGASSWEALPARILFQMDESEGKILGRDELRRELCLDKVPIGPTTVDLPQDGYSAEVLGVIEGKMIHSFDHRFGTYEAVSLSGKGVRELPHPSVEQLRDPTYQTEPRKWINLSNVQSRLRDQGWNYRWLIAFRDVTSRTDFRTVISTLLPYQVTDRSAPVVLFRSEPLTKAAEFVALMNSFAFDYVARQKVGGTHLTFNVFRQIAAPSLHDVREYERRVAGGSERSWILPRVVELVATSWDAAPLLCDLGFPGAAPFAWDENRRLLLRSELDAWFFHLYGIAREDADYIMETFPIVKRKDIAAQGDFRTKRLVLEVYDAMAKAMETGETYRTILDPPPADPSLCHDPSTRPDWADEHLR